MHYLPFAVILAFVSLSVFASDPDPDRKFTEPPNHGEIIGVKATAYEIAGIPNQGVSKFNIHPGVVVGGPNRAGDYQVAMVSKNLPHNPPQHPIKDFNPHSTVYGNVDLTKPKNVPVDKMRVWVSKKTFKEEPPLTPENLHRLKTAMVPHEGWQRPKAPTPPPAPPRQPTQKSKASTSSHRLNPQAPKFQPGPPVQGGSFTHAHPQGASSGPHFPAVQQHASGSRIPLPSRIHNPAFHAAAQHMVANGHPHPGSQAVNRPGPPNPQRPKSPLKRPYPPLARPNPAAGRPYPPPKPHIPSVASGSSYKRPKSPSSPQSQHSANGKGGSQPTGRTSRSQSPQPKSNTKGKNRARSPVRTRSL